ncbi:MAG TPA: DUF1634 domain-containing protein [Nitrososphaeraceae archaeon]|nr:DUF1634 domain-containing protein [Nitrososphaeraceae archaeon]
MKDEKKEISLELVISYILVTGIIFSLLTISYGLLLYYISTGKTSPHFTPKWQIGRTDFFSYIRNLVAYFTSTNASSSSSINPITIMALGIVLLIITPFIRVIASVIYFGYKRNFKYFLITCFVLIALTLSLVAH